MAIGLISVLVVVLIGVSVFLFIKYRTLIEEGVTSIKRGVYIQTQREEDLIDGKDEDDAIEITEKGVTDITVHTNDEDGGYSTESNSDEDEPKVVGGTAKEKKKEGGDFLRHDE